MKGFHSKSRCKLHEQGSYDRPGKNQQSFNLKLTYNRAIEILGHKEPDEEYNRRKVEKPYRQ